MNGPCYIDMNELGPIWDWQSEVLRIRTFLLWEVWSRHDIVKSPLRCKTRHNAQGEMAIDWRKAKKKGKRSDLARWHRSISQQKVHNVSKSNINDMWFNDRMRKIHYARPKTRQHTLTFYLFICHSYYHK